MPPSADSSKTVISYWLEYAHKVLVNCLEEISQPRKKKCEQVK